MKKAILIVLITLASNAFAEELCKENAIVFNGFSKHFEKKTKYAKKNGYNEFNYGLGYKCILNDFYDFNQELELGYLKNSYREDSYYISYNILKPMTQNFSIGLKASANSGYEILGSSYHGIQAGIVPTMQYKFTNTLATNFTIAPNFAFINFQKKF